MRQYSTWVFKGEFHDGWNLASKNLNKIFVIVWFLLDILVAELKWRINTTNNINTKLGRFSLRWNDFESNISKAFKEFRDDCDLFDVTIACEDKQVQTHKLILSVWAPFFKRILGKNLHQHSHAPSRC